MIAIRKDFLPTDLAPILHQNGVNGCIAVQADDSEEETNFLLHLADENSFIKGVVGWVDLLSDNVEERLLRFFNDNKFKGIRHIVQGEPEGFMLRKDFQRGISKLEKFNLTYDILIHPNQLIDAVKLVEKFPNQLFILDHMAKPNIKEGAISEWARSISQIAEFPNVSCKISGMMTEANWKHWQYNDFIPYMDIVFNSFGIDRVLFGSDWPVCLLAGKYEEAYSILEKYIDNFSFEEKNKVMGENAKKIYRLHN
jgi:L-fuconolactonase